MSTVALIANFRANLVAACQRAHISQAELARRADVHYVTVNRILSGAIASPKIDVCERLASAAGVDPEQIFLAPKPPRRKHA